MSGIPSSSQELGPEAQRLLDYLRAHPNEQMTVTQIAQTMDCTEEEAKIHLEALAYQGEIEKTRPEGGETVYCRPQRT